MKKSKHGHIKTKKEYNQWFQDNYQALYKKYWRLIGKDIIGEALSDAYLNMVKNNKFKEIKNFDAYISTYFFNRFQRFHTEKYKDRFGYMINTKHCKVIRESDLPVTQQLEMEYSNRDEAYQVQKFTKRDDVAIANTTDIHTLLYDLLQQVEHKLELWERELYYLLYVKGHTIKDVCTLYGYCYQTMTKLTKPLRFKVKKLILEELKQIEGIEPKLIKELEEWELK